MLSDSKRNSTDGDFKAGHDTRQASADGDASHTKLGIDSHQDEPNQGSEYQQQDQYNIYGSIKKRSKTPGEGAQKRFFNLR